MSYVWFTEETAKLVPADLVAEVEAAYIAVNEACDASTVAYRAYQRSSTKANLAAYRASYAAHTAALAWWEPVSLKLLVYYLEQDGIKAAEAARIAEGPETIDLFGDMGSPMHY